MTARTFHRRTFAAGLLAAPAGLLAAGTGHVLPGAVLTAAGLAAAGLPVWLRPGRVPRRAR